MLHDKKKDFADIVNIRGFKIDYLRLLTWSLSNHKRKQNFLQLKSE